MPELPDIAAYLTALEPRVLGQPLEALRIASPFVLRSVSPRPSEAVSLPMAGLRRLGKRIVFSTAGPPQSRIHLVVHLMIAGRLHWKERGAKVPGRYGLAAFDFPAGTLLFTEAGTKKRASLTLVRGDAGLAALDPGGLDVLRASAEEF